ncbi:MAG: hypothetical protein ACI8QS_002042, partial [Planctomycetota bacterium]
MVVVLLVVFTLMMLGMAFFQLGTSGQKRLHGTYDNERALHLAESGLAESLVAIRAGATGNIGTADQPVTLAGGVFWSEATPTGSGTSRVKVTALIGSGRRAVEAILDGSPGAPPLFSSVLNSDKAMILNQGVMIDSYDSSDGTYADQLASDGVVYNGIDYLEDNGDVRSNEDIFLNNSSTVFGDAIPGVGHIVDDAATDAYVSGTTTAATENFIFAPIAFPTGTTSAGNYSVAGLGNTLASGTYEFGDFSIGNTAELTIEGPATVIVDNFAGGRNGNIFVDTTNGPITFFVRGNYSHIKGFEVDALPGSANAIAFMVEGSADVVFPSATNIRGAYYVPNASITFANGNECWGAFAGGQIAMSNDMKFHFDEDLMSHWQTDGKDEEEPRSILAWSEAAVDQ